MEEIDIATVTKRSIHGVFALVSRTFFIQIVSFATNFLLTIFLSPSIFGVFFVVSAFTAFLSYFSDIGMAAALIQKKEEIKEKDLQTTFTIQQAMVLTAVIIGLLLSGKIGSFYHLNSEGIFLFRAFIIAFFLSSLKTIPSIVLERNLRFDKLVIPQIVETITFNLVVLVCAIKGLGITSFTLAVLARGVLGLITIYIIAPWRIRFGFSKEAAKKLLSFGVPFQTNSILAFIKDDLLVVYLGKVLPLAQVGYIGFAQKWAFTPLRLIMDNIIRITFPSFSRVQHDSDVLSKGIEKSLFVSSFLIFPSLAGLVVLSPYFIHFIPKYEKWEPALLSLAFFSINAGLSSVSTPLTNALNAIGRIKITLYLMIFWTISTWVLTPLAIFSFGFNGVALVSAIIATSVVAVVYIAQKSISFNTFGAIKNQLFSSFSMGVVIYFLSQMFVKNIQWVGFMIIVGGVIYFLMMFLLSKKELLADIKLIKENLKG